MPEFHLFAKGPRPVAAFSYAVEADGWGVLTGQMPLETGAPSAALPVGALVGTNGTAKRLQDMGA